MEQPGGDGQAVSGVMTAAPAAACSVPGVRDAWQMWRKNQRQLYSRTSGLLLRTVGQPLVRLFYLSFMTFSD